MRSVNEAGTSASLGVGTDRRSSTAPRGPPGRRASGSRRCRRRGRVASSRPAPHARQSPSWRGPTPSPLRDRIPPCAEGGARLVSWSASMSLWRCGSNDSLSLAERDDHVTFVAFLDGCHRVEQRQDRVPLDVVAQRVAEDLRQRVPLMAVQVPGSSHVDSSRPAPSGEQAAGPSSQLCRGPQRARPGSWLVERTGRRGRLGRSRR